MNPKLLIESVILLVLLFLVTGCDRENNFSNAGKITIDNVKHGNCKNTSNTKSAEAEEIQLIAVSATQLKVVHRNVVFNCCPKSLIVECDTDENTIYIVEKEEEPACNCICPYDLEFVINSLSEGTYTIKIKGYKPFDIEFNESTNVLIIPEKENNFSNAGKITIDNVKHGNCKKRNNTKSAEEVEEIQLIAVNATQLKVIHRNAVFNCCPKSLVVDCEADGNTINIVEKEEELGCKCICPFDLEFVINSLSEGTYTIKIKGYKPFDIEFNESTDILIIPEKEKDLFKARLFRELI